jgi:16S rRNA (cytosine1402-N4)-methyltransferase
MMSVVSHSSVHYPVMLPEVLEALAPCDGEVYVDGTFGAGGYSKDFLEKADCHVYAIDRDFSAHAHCAALQEDYGGRLTFLHGCFGDVAELLEEEGVSGVDGFVLDLGVSSMQLDEADRGFSFRFDGPLDMRMDTSSDGQTAADIVNSYDEGDLADLIYRYGEERHSRRVARRIVERRKEERFERTLDLADVVRSAVPKSPRDQSDQATRTFQALRIAVNDELGEVERALGAAAQILRPGGRLVVVSFHSLEDRLVKTYLRAHSGQKASASRHMPEQVGHDDVALFEMLSRKAVKPSAAEIAENSRSRSARLRAAVRLSQDGGVG